MDGLLTMIQNENWNIDPSLLEFTLLTSSDPLTKSYTVSEEMPKKAADPFLVRGSAARFPISTNDFVDQFPALLEALDANSCLVLGALADTVMGDFADITTKDRHAPREPGNGSPLIWRGKAWLGYRDRAPALLGIDHDGKDIPRDLRARFDAEGGLLAVLEAVCPLLRAAARVARPSVSTGITVASTGKASPGGGLHVYIPVVDGGDAQEFVSRLHDNLVLAGWGFAFVSEAGCISIRSLVDTAASGVGERLWFEGAAILGEGLVYAPGAREPLVQRGVLLDTKAALPPLTAEQAARLRQIHEELRAAVAGEAEQKRRLRAGRVRAQIVRRGADIASVDGEMEQLLDAERRGVLNGRHVLHTDGGKVVSVSDVLNNRAAYHKATCADPLEPEYGGGQNKAILFTDGRRARLFSHAHGGRLYDLALDETDVVNTVSDARGEGKDAATVMQRLVGDVRFAAGGWAQVEAALGLRAAEVLGFAVPGDVETAVAAIASHDDASPDSGPAIEQTEVSITSGSDDLLDADAAIDLLMRDFNKRFAVVAEGGTVSIVRLAYNAELYRSSPVSMTLDAFKLLYGNRYIPIPQTKRGGDMQYQSTPATVVWLKHPARRTCTDGFCLDPTGRAPSSCFNLWQGFGVEEKRGDWSKLRSLIRDVLASGNEVYDHYIVQWLAHLVQRPHESPGVALVFRGDEGVGKGTPGRAVMRLMRPHAMQITHTKHLTGPFNAHMRTVLFLFADEAFFAGDRANEGTLKGLITEQFRVNEGKGRDATLGRNRIHLMMASNNGWVVPASADARRYAVFDVSSSHKQDQSYFGPILAEMDADGDGDGIAAMLYDLRRLPLDVNLVRTAPETVGLQAQRIASLQGHALWLFDVLTRGYVSAFTSEPWPERCTTEELFDSYENWARDTKERYPTSRHALGKFLTDIFPAHRPRISASDGSTTRPPGYRLGSLDSARTAFAEKRRIGPAWTTDDACGGDDVG